jgi:hypothetical protein
VKKKKKSNQSTSYNIPIKFVFVGVITSFLISCSGWSIMGHALDEEYPSVLSTIIDKDSVEHFYNGSIHSGDNWCYNHNQYEKVEIK